jgi:hypothetical protein
MTNNYVSVEFNLRSFDLSPGLGLSSFSFLLSAASQITDIYWSEESFLNMYLIGFH